MEDTINTPNSFNDVHFNNLVMNRNIIRKLFTMVTPTLCGRQVILKKKRVIRSYSYLSVLKTVHLRRYINEGTRIFFHK